MMTTSEQQPTVALKTCAVVPAADMAVESGSPSANALCLFLADYCATLLGCGATCMRMEKNLGRMAAAYGHKVEITIMPRHIHLSLTDSRGCAVTSIASVKACGVSFNINTRLSELSWDIADGKISFDDARRKLAEIVASDPRNKWLELMLVAVANASFCRLFGGDPAAMAIVGAATVAGYYLKLLLLAAKVDVRVVVMLCAFVSTVLGATDMLFSIGSTPLVAVGSSVLYLVPGIPFLNSFSDMLNRHYICAFSRFTDAVVLTCCLSLGLCGGMMLMNVGMF